MQTNAAEDTEKLRAFEQRLQREGSAAFASGPVPWEEWDDIGTLGTYRVWVDGVRHTAPEPPPRKPLSGRLLTGLAQLSVLALLVGSTGVYFSMTTPGQLAGTGIQPPPIVVADRAQPRPVTAALPVIRARTDEPAPAMPDRMDEPAAADRPDLAQLAAAVVPLQLEPVPVTPGDTPARTPDASAQADLDRTLAALPVPAAGPVREAAPLLPAPMADAATGQTVADDPPVETLPQQIALLTPAVETLPDNPARKPAPAQAARELANTWVVNLASYNFESMAKRKLASFRDKGVNAELAHVTVKGKPMIRIRTTGHKSAREARDWVALLEERLELQGAWIAKYQPSESNPDGTDGN